MDAQELRNLSEAYLEVYSEIDESRQVQMYGQPELNHDYDERNLKNRGDLSKRDAGSIARSRLTGQRSAVGRVRGSNPHNDGHLVNKEAYDIILSHLLDEGYAETQKAAEAIMVNMSEEWRDSVVEAYKDLPVDRMIRQTGTKQFKHGMRVGSGSSMNPKVPAQVGKMSYTALTHDPEKAKAKSKLKKD